ncbi:MAG TPA: isoprenylcysteine carboxylmethyltransferase family protein [Terriglobales bacterium]
MGKFIVNIILTVVVGTALGAIVWQQSIPASAAMRTTGLILLVIGFVFWSIARFQLGASLTVTAQARQLVSRGLYSKIRNPVYVFGSAVIAGLILALGRPIWLLIFVVIVPMQIWRARKEASVLEATFGDQYRTYRQSTWF